MILSFDLIATERLPSSYFKCIVKQTFLDKIQPQVFKLLILKFVLMNIYISNLSYAVNDGDLKDLFGEYGEISSAKVITDRETGRSRGFGFVEMADDAQGQKAIDELNQAEYDGKVINVTVARPRTERPAGNRGGFHRNNNFNGERKERRY